MVEPRLSGGTMGNAIPREFKRRRRGTPRAGMPFHQEYIFADEQVCVAPPALGNHSQFNSYGYVAGATPP
ncbi:MAG TPA: hypothetical protein VJ723_12125 [Candidatus Angelobacter sp.]|nr:hypothetical protein [Candidatus Angelobacter sp.]